VVESPSKPGDSTLQLLGVLTVRRAPRRAACPSPRAALNVPRAPLTPLPNAPRPSPPPPPRPQPLMRKLGPAADPANLKPATDAAALWAGYIAYLGIVMFSTLPPGPPAYATPQPVLLEAFDESVNIFWIKWV
jgi:hypothetical protein